MKYPVISPRKYVSTNLVIGCTFLGGQQIYNSCSLTVVTNYIQIILLHMNLSCKTGYKSIR